ncbi:VWA domain-containing protein [Filimonas effusa]|uniref:VWA domain-containing protein n=1 Tax=Filimonas effusa TaxID=2508721 RepID=A0A4Q1D655_9BACT|nr:VWA domain-containing protein [Filimonas effusa]RXK83446.1 VWA domain-containing protein [Filimonas effusa]
MHFSVERTDYLLGLTVIIPLVILFLLVLRWKKGVKKKLGDAHLIDLLTQNYSPRQYVLKFVVVILAIGVGVLAFANVRVPSSEDDKEKKAGIDVMIALDVSKSMLSEDVKPSRLEKARQFTNLLINKLGDNRVGLVLFAGKAYLQMPLTSDPEAAKLFVSNANPNAVPVQGTVIGDALELCDNSLDTKQKKYKAVVLISDGEDHDPKAHEILRQLNEHGVILHTIGVGTTEGAPIKEPGTFDYKRDENGHMVVTKLNEKELSDLAAKSGGTYHNLENAANTALDVAGSLSTMEKKAFLSGTGGSGYASIFPYLLAFVVLLLIAELFIPEVKKRW